MMLGSPKGWGRFYKGESCFVGWHEFGCMRGNGIIFYKDAIHLEGWINSHEAYPDANDIIPYKFDT